MALDGNAIGRQIAAALGDRADEAVPARRQGQRAGHLNAQITLAGEGHIATACVVTEPGTVGKFDYVSVRILGGRIQGVRVEHADNHRLGHVTRGTGEDHLLAHGQGPPVPVIAPQLGGPGQPATEGLAAYPQPLVVMVDVLNPSKTDQVGHPPVVLGLGKKTVHQAAPSVSGL